MTMNKNDLINEVADAILSKKEARAAVDCMLSKILEALGNNETVRLIGFGTFKVNKQKAREGRNPQTGETIQIDEKMVPKFVPGKAMKEAVNQ
jgi:DNA-binding protein HU-beta